MCRRRFTSRRNFWSKTCDILRFTQKSMTKRVISGKLASRETGDFTSRLKVTNTDFVSSKSTQSKFFAIFSSFAILQVRFGAFFIRSYSQIGIISILVFL